MNRKFYYMLIALSLIIIGPLTAQVFLPEPSLEYLENLKAEVAAEVSAEVAAEVSAEVAAEVSAEATVPVTVESSYLNVKLMAAEFLLWNLDPANPGNDWDFNSIATLVQAAATDAAGYLEGREIPEGLLNNRYYRESLRYKRLADESFEYGDYDAAAGYAAEALRYAQLSDEYILAELVKYDEARKRAEEEAQRRALELADADRQKELDEAARLRLELLMQNADAAIARAKNRLDWAKGVDADKFYPREYTTANTAYDQAIEARFNKQYEEAIAAAERVIAALANVSDLAPLPAQYTVRPWAETRDCFWNIAGYAWVYGDPTKWRTLYQANKAKLRQPDNPDLIHPGTILDIPSIDGEKREGLWVSGRAYAPLPKRK